MPGYFRMVNPFFLLLIASWLCLIDTLEDTKAVPAVDVSYNVLQNDGSYEFGYANRDRAASYHFSDANSRNVVRGKFGSRNPGTGRIDETIYTAGPRGYRPRGPNIHRKYNLNQNGPKPIGNHEDPLFDPSEDPSYSFGFRTPTYNRDETANRNADVSGRYSFIDDIGERHNVDYIAGKNTGFHVKSAYPDSNPRPYGPLRFAGKRPRGQTSIQRGLDGSYRFVSGGPDQRRTETSDAAGNVRGSYTFLDDKGKQHSVHYIAGPNIGYRVLKTSKDYPTLYPFGPRPALPPLRPTLDPFDETIPPASYDDYIFNHPEENLNTAASGHVKPRPNPTTKPPKDDSDEGDDNKLDDFYANKPNKGSTATSASDDFFASKPNLGSTPSSTKPSGSYDGDDDDDDDDDDIFGGESDKRTTSRPPISSTGYPSVRPTGFPTSESSKLTTVKPDSTSQSRPSSTPTRPFDSTTPSRPFDFGTTAGYGHGDINADTQFSFYPGDDESWVGGGIGSTILRNVGRKNVNLPPGVSVRAHVQSINILPYGSRLPSPSAQLVKDSTVSST